MNPTTDLPGNSRHQREVKSCPGNEVSTTPQTPTTIHSTTRFTLWFGSNQLSGSIPSELGNLANLGSLFLGSNQFSGCVPAELLDVPSNDVANLGLPSC